MGQYDPVIPRRVDGTAVVGQKGEITSSFDATQAYLHDGSTPGGRPLIETVGAGLRRINGLLLPNAIGGRIVVVGDSIVQQDSSVSNGVWTESSGWAELSIAMSHTGMKFVRNAGAGGETSQQIAARFDKDVLAYHPDVVMLMCGTNNLIAGIGWPEYAANMDAIEEMIVKALTAGAAMFLVGPPVSSLYPEQTKTAQAFYQDLADFYAIPFLNTYNITCDALTGLYKTNWSDDGVHPNKTAMEQIGLHAAQMLTHPWGFIRRPHTCAFSDSLGGIANLIKNGTFALQNGGPNIPDFWSLGASGGNLQADADWPWSGKVAQITKKGNTGGEYLLYGDNITGEYKAGDVLVFTGNVVVTGQAAGVQGFTVGINFDGTGDNAVSLNHMVYNQNYLFSQEIVVPFSPGNMVPTVFTLNDGVYSVSNLTLTNQTVRQAIWRPGAV